MASPARVTHAHLRYHNAATQMQQLGHHLGNPERLLSPASLYRTLLSIELQNLPSMRRLLLIPFLWSVAVCVLLMLDLTYLTSPEANPVPRLILTPPASEGGWFSSTDPWTHEAVVKYWGGGRTPHEKVLRVVAFVACAFVGMTKLATISVHSVDPSMSVNLCFLMALAHGVLCYATLVSAEGGWGSFVQETPAGSLRPVTTVTVAATEALCAVLCTRASFVAHRYASELAREVSAMKYHGWIDGVRTSV